MNRIVNRVNYMISKLKTLIYYKFIFGHVGRNSCICKPLKFDNPENVRIGEGVYIAKGAWIYTTRDKNDMKLSICNSVQIGHHSHIVASRKIIIENEVLIADKVFISDCTHNYMDINTPVLNQGITSIKPVTIGKGSWVGENVCVLGANIGKHCVIGANSVVVNDIPDYSIAVGSPARVVKKYDENTNNWVKQ